MTGSLAAMPEVGLLLCSEFGYLYITNSTLKQILHVAWTIDVSLKNKEKPFGAK
jgi:hypothetical protein